jgi:hypothetical protein
MENEHGGYRTPSNPAPVSGPGAHSQRTDRGPKQHQITGGSYGSSQEFAQQQSASPLAAKPGSPGGTAPAGLDLSALTGLSAPTSMPEVPVTDGAAAGAGVGPEAMFGQPVRPDSEEARALGKNLQVMIQIADSDGATPAFKRYVREVIANL